MDGREQPAAPPGDAREQPELRHEQGQGRRRQEPFLSLLAQLPRADDDAQAGARRSNEGSRPVLFGHDRDPPAAGKRKGVVGDPAGIADRPLRNDRARHATIVASAILSDADEEWGIPSRASGGSTEDGINRGSAFLAGRGGRSGTVVQSAADLRRASASRSSPSVALFPNVLQSLAERAFPTYRDLIRPAGDKPGAPDGGPAASYGPVHVAARNRAGTIGIEISSSLPLQMLLYFNVWFSPFWWLATIIVTKFKVTHFATGVFHEFLMWTVIIVYAVSEPVRIYLGYNGNLREKVQATARNAADDGSLIDLRRCGLLTTSRHKFFTWATGPRAHRVFPPNALPYHPDSGLRRRPADCARGVSPPVRRGAERCLPLGDVAAAAAHFAVTVGGSALGAFPGDEEEESDSSFGGVKDDGDDGGDHRLPGRRSRRNRRRVPKRDEYLGIAAEEGTSDLTREAGVSTAIGPGPSRGSLWMLDRIGAAD
ncbi:MAG: hypothetical protein BJ554DRAFT_8267 [Olpidium bornovanus]|uniref:Uncharacterized protein n=1 Tax=Olpidium bornovanus TaxID=278681 RepID=A0A8H7ZV14_9FUNG|nr:MAG: hypothetical protein BJ554DRAFT_8267 [Olpidium bornovanus]